MARSGKRQNINRGKAVGGRPGPKSEPVRPAIPDTVAEVELGFADLGEGLHFTEADRAPGLVLVDPAAELRRALGAAEEARRAVPADHVLAVMEASRLAHLGEVYLHHQVWAWRQAGATWQQVADLFGVSRASAHQRFSRHMASVDLATKLSGPEGAEGA